MDRFGVFIGYLASWMLTSEKLDDALRQEGPSSGWRAQAVIAAPLRHIHRAPTV
jgi:hypothetical protein